MESLNITCVSASGMKLGINKYKLLSVIPIFVASGNVVYMISCKSAVFNVIWYPSPLVTFLNVLQNPNICSKGSCPTILPLFACTVWLSIKILLMKYY